MLLVVPRGAGGALGATPALAELDTLSPALMASLVVGAVIILSAADLDTALVGISLQAGRADALGRVVGDLAVGAAAARRVITGVGTLLVNTGLVVGAILVLQTLV